MNSTLMLPLKSALQSRHFRTTFSIALDTTYTFTEKGCFIVDQDWRKITLPKQCSNLIRTIMPYIDGINSIYEISEFSNLDLGVIANIIGFLFENGVIENKEFQPIPSLSFHNHLLNRARWGRTKIIKDNGLDLSLNTLSEKKIYSLLIHAFHYISSFDRHTTEALSNLRSSIKKYAFFKYVAEKYRYGFDIKHKLENLAFKLKEDQFLLKSEALILFLENIAQKDMFSYGICLALGENPTPFEKEVLSFEWDKYLGSHTTNELGLFLKSFQDHDDLCDYENISEVFYNESDDICSNQQKETYNNVRRYLNYVDIIYKHATKDHFSK